MNHDDPQEFVGRDHTIKADPIKSNASTPVAVPALAAELARPEPKKPAGSHPKFAIERPRKNFEAAKLETEAARVAYRVATDEFKSAEKAEGVAVAEWITLNPPPDADTVYRAHVKRDLDARAARVAQGLPPVGPPKVPANRSRIDTLAAQRPRQTPQMPSAPLRSPVARRLA